MHAQLFIASTIESSTLPEALKQPSLDVLHVTVESFGIDDSRALVDAASRNPLEADAHSFVICTSSLTVQAQNALLKLFEDPPGRSRFYLVVPHEGVLIDTLKSRLATGTANARENETAHAEEFCNMSYTLRFDTIAALHKRKDNAGLERIVRELALMAAADAYAFPRHVLTEILFVENAVRVKGGSKKMLLEHLALLIPAAR